MRARLLPAWLLSVFDLLGMAKLMAITAVIITLMPAELQPHLLSLPVIVLLATMRAAIVPTPPRWTALVTFLSLGIGMLLAVKADAVLKGSSTYKTLLIWVYAIAPPVAGLMGMMFFDQHIGPLVKFAALFGWDMKVGLNYNDTAIAMIIVSVWKQIPYNFIFILSGLQSIPVSVREAAAIDCRSGFRRFWTMTLPLLAPTAFFLLIINMTYALFDTFGVIDVMVKDKAANNPITLVYKVYMDGFRGNDIGGSSAQSVILMIVVFVLTVLQFRFIERRIHYT